MNRESLVNRAELERLSFGLTRTELQSSPCHLLARWLGKLPNVSEIQLYHLLFEINNPYPSRLLRLCIRKTAYYDCSISIIYINEARGVKAIKSLTRVILRKTNPPAPIPPPPFENTRLLKGWTLWLQSGCLSADCLAVIPFRRGWVISIHPWVTGSSGY